MSASLDGRAASLDGDDSTNTAQVGIQPKQTINRLFHFSVFISVSRICTFSSDCYRFEKCSETDEVLLAVAHYQA